MSILLYKKILLLTLLAFVFCFHLNGYSEDQPWIYEQPPNGQVLHDWLLLGPIDTAAFVDRPAENAQFSLFRDFFNTDLLEGEDNIRPASGGVTVINDESYEWKLLQDENLIDLADIFPDLEYHLIYAYAEIIVEQAGKYGLHIGSDDACKIWINDELVYEFWGGRAAQINDDFRFVELQEGNNRILLKVLNFQMGWGFYCQFLREEGFPASAVIERDMENIFETLSDPNEIDFGRLFILIAVVGTIFIAGIVLFVYLKIKRRSSQ